MIPSENYCSKEVLEAMGSILNNKYAEGYPKKRYYQGNRFIDEVEELAIERAKKLFGAEYVNVQLLSGSDANMSVYFALLNPGDKILGMELSQGGHLTHGSPVNFSGKMYNFISYGVEKDTELLDMEKVREIALRERPKMIVCGFTAYPRKVDFKRFSEIAKEIDALLLADVSHIAGLIAGGAHESPVPYCDIVTLTTHKTLRGPRSAIILCKEKYGKAIDKAVFPGLHGGPHEHTIAAKAVAFKEAMTPEFSEYSRKIVHNAKTLSEYLMKHGVKLVSNGTDNHLILIDLIKTGFVGKIGVGKEYAVALEDAGIITNANTVPYDPSTPFKPSGIRLGTPILTTRGFGEKEMQQVGKWIIEVLANPTDVTLKERVRSEVKNLCEKFPFY